MLLVVQRVSVRCVSPLKELAPRAILEILTARQGYLSFGGYPLTCRWPLRTLFLQHITVLWVHLMEENEDTRKN